MTWRAVHDGICTSPRFVTLEEWEQLLFLQMVVRADSWGRLPGHPFQLKLLCCPASGRTPDTTVPRVPNPKCRAMLAYRLSLNSN